MANNFEALLVRSLNAYFITSHIPGIAERRPQKRYSKQFCDIVVDSPKIGHLGIECKSIASPHLYFSSNFSEDKEGKHQIDNLDYYFTNSGREGYLVVELRNRGGNRCYWVPWIVVMSRYVSGEKGFRKSEIKAYPEIKKFKKTKLYNVRPLFSSNGT